mgnify:CR=1 FL=1
MALQWLLCGVAAQCGDWPQFRGPERTGVSSETGLLPRWPEGGPPQTWAITGIGTGYSSPAIVGDTAFITGDRGEDLLLTALDSRTGARRWQTVAGRSWKGQYPGARSTCTLADGRLYLLDAHGRLLCAEPTTGRELWSTDILARFKGRALQWGLSECLVVDRGRVLITAGGDTAFLAALDARTGDTVWAGPPLRFTRTVAFGGKPVQPPQPDVDRAGYASPIVFGLGGRRFIAAVGARHFVLADAADGALLWTREVPVVYEVIGAIPVWCGTGLLFSAPDVGSTFLKVSVTATGVLVTELWRHDIDNCHGALLYAEGALFGSGYRLYRPWACLDPASGTPRYELTDLAKGATLFADGRLYAWSEKGVMALLRPAADRFVTEGTLRLPGTAAGDVWSHPALADGRLFLRRHDSLFCYDVRAPAP